MTRSRSRRVWAWIALAAAAGVLATLVVLVFRNLGALVFALGALGLAGAAAWVAVTRRRIVRLLGVVVGIVALAGGAVALVLLFSRPDRKRPLWWALAAVITAGMAWSRTYLQVHWLSDVFAGSLLGIAVTLGSFAVAQILLERRRKEAP